MQELLAMISTVASSTVMIIFRRMLHFIGTNKLFSVVSKNQQSAELGVTLDSHARWIRNVVSAQNLKPRQTLIQGYLYWLL